jgi:Raf kinase inhibitor-like YbhB/YbcL family protein
MSYAVFLTDLNNATIHWVIWDLPAATRMLPAGLPNTATLTTPVTGMQAHHVPFFGTADSGYRGPCPNGMLHTYQFEVVALDVATLPTLTTTSTPIDVHGQTNMHALAHGDLTGMSSAAAAGQ